MFCKQCGAQNEEDSVFCAECGTALNTTDADADFKEDLEYAKELLQKSSDEDVKDKGKTFGIISLCAGGAAVLLSLVLLVGGCCCSFCCGAISMPVVAFVLIIPALLGVAGVIMGIVGMVLSKKSGAKSTLSLLGLLVSIVGVLVPLVLLVLFIGLTFLGIGTVLFSEAASFSNSYYDNYYYY